jgi:hypothetical protein
VQLGFVRSGASAPSLEAALASRPELQRSRGRFGPCGLWLLAQSVLGVATFGSSALAQSADAGAAHASLSAPEPGNTAGTLDEPEVPLAPGAGLLKRIENPALLSERVLTQLEKRASGVDTVPTRSAAAAPGRGNVVERSPVPVATSADVRREERQRRTRAFETEAGVTVLSNRNADAAPAPRRRAPDLPGPAMERPTGETSIDPPRLTSTHSLRPLSAAQSERNALSVGLPLLLLLGASTLAGALWWHKKGQI